jgi:hypothetical protein
LVGGMLRFFKITDNLRRKPLPQKFLDRHVFFSALCLMFFFSVGGIATGLADPDGPEGQTAAQTFDIPAQPLAPALDAYSAITGKEVFYDGAAERGRRSTTIKGYFTPVAALNTMLLGTSLLALPSGSNGYTLVISPEPGALGAAAHIASDRRYARYFAVIQTGIREVLCRRAEIIPGRGRLVFNLWIDSTGVVRGVALRGTLGDPKRDALFSAVLQSTILDEPPPSTMQQPVTMALFPERQTELRVCPDAEARRRR